MPSIGLLRSCVRAEQPVLRILVAKNTVRIDVESAAASRRKLPRTARHRLAISRLIALSMRRVTDIPFVEVFPLAPGPLMVTISRSAPPINSGAVDSAWSRLVAANPRYFDGPLLSVVSLGPASAEHPSNDPPSDEAGAAGHQRPHRASHGSRIRSARR